MALAEGAAKCLKMGSGGGLSGVERGVPGIVDKVCTLLTVSACAYNCVSVGVSVRVCVCVGGWVLSTVKLRKARKEFKC